MFFHAQQRIANAGGISSYRVGQLVGVVCLVAIVVLVARRKAASRQRPFTGNIKVTTSRKSVFDDQHRVEPFVSINSQLATTPTFGTRSRALVIAASLMCLVLVAGYAFERYHSQPATAGIAPPITDTQARPSSPPGSLERLNDVVLRASDLPGDWTSNPYQADPNNDAGQAAFAKCIGTMASNPDVVAEAHSDDFSLGQMTISSSATSYRTQATVQSDTAALQRPRLSTCFTQLMQTVLKSTLPTGSTLDSPSFRITPRSAGDPRGVVATATGSVKISVDGRHLTAYMAFGFIAGPKIEADVDAFNIDAPIPPQLMNAMVTKVASRATRS